MSSNRHRPHYSGTYQREAKRVREAATRNPATRCWRCGLLLQEHRRHKTGKPPTWQAGHVETSKVGGELRPEASTCNTSHGAAWGNRRRKLGAPSRTSRVAMLNTSRAW